MKICIIGSPGSGKTLLSNVLWRLLNDSFALFHGDDYFQENEDRINQLNSDLGNSEDWIYEHPLAFKHCSRLNREVDFLIAVAPSRLLLRQRLVSRGGFTNEMASEDDFDRLDDLLSEQITSARNRGVRVLQGNGFQDLLPAIISAIWGDRVLRTKVDMIVPKVSSYCNLNCSYCYMFKSFDDVWQQKPPFISVDTAKVLGQRINEYISNATHRRGKPFIVIYHGGEPLLLGKDKFIEVTEAILSGLVGCSTQVKFGVQTNGTLISNETLQALDNYGFSVGVSIDGTTEMSNKERQTKAGGSALDAIISGINMAKRFPWRKGCFAGCLSVVNPDFDGNTSYKEMCEVSPSGFDFLLLDHNWDNPPIKSVAPFLKAAFNEWLNDSQSRPVRIFQTLIGKLLGGRSGSDAFGIEHATTVFLDVEGNYESHNVLRVAYKGAWQLPYNIKHHSIEGVTNSPEMLKWWLHHYKYDNKCISCRYFFVCGGGYLPHRYSTEKEFQNPSIYCDDIIDFLKYAESMVGDIVNASSLKR